MMMNKSISNGSIVIEINNTIRSALKKLQKNKKRFLICIDNNYKVKGVMTDGDIRRAFLKNFTIDDLLNNVYNKNFKYLTIDSNFDDVCNLFREEKIDFLPVLDKNKKLINVLTKRQFHIMLLEDYKFDLKCDFLKFDNVVLEHEIFNRPWGFYKSTLLTSHAQAKIITIFPSGELSLQEHKKREEHWVIIRGEGKVILGESVLYVYPGKYIYIPKGCKHKIINSSNENLILSEVQLGNYFGEDDIIRYSDKYGRVKNNKY